MGKTAEGIFGAFSFCVIWLLEMQLTLSHLIFQVILPVHLVVGYIKVVIGVVVFKHTAGDREVGDRGTDHHRVQCLRHLWNVWKVLNQCCFSVKKWPRVRTYNSLISYGTARWGRGGDGGGGGGEEEPPSPWWWWWPLLLPRVRVFWKLMSVCVALSTQSGIATMATEETEELTVPFPHTNVPEEETQEIQEHRWRSGAEFKLKLLGQTEIYTL